MKIIIANKKFMEEVAQGLKRQTLRFWKNKSRIQQGEIVALFNYREKMLIKVTDIYQKSVNDITVQEAVDNGYLDIDKFRVAIFSVYKQLNFEATIIKFELP